MKFYIIYSVLMGFNFDTFLNRERPIVSPDQKFAQSRASDDVRGECRDGSNIWVHIYIPHFVYGLQFGDDFA